MRVVEHALDHLEAVLQRNDLHVVDPEHVATLLAMIKGLRERSPLWKVHRSISFLISFYLISHLQSSNSIWLIAQNLLAISVREHFFFVVTLMNTIKT